METVGPIQERLDGLSLIYYVNTTDPPTLQQFPEEKKKYCAQFVNLFNANLNV